MGNRRFAHISSDEEEEEPKRRTKRTKLREDEVVVKNVKKEPGCAEEKMEQPEEAPDAKPIGDAIRVTGKGRGRRSHFEAFEYDNNQYELEDPVLLLAEGGNQKPYVAIIKDIAQTRSGSLKVTGQWFYRPEEAERKGGGNWQSRDTRELFYSFHRDEIPAESVMHKCVVHFVPIHKQIPSRKVHPGFFVQKVYDTVERKLWKLTDKDYEDHLQHEIDLLVQKTLSRLGNLPDIESEDTVPDQDEQLRTNKRSLKRKNIPPLDVTREDEETTRLDPNLNDQNLKSDTPGSCAVTTSEYYSLLENLYALTGETHRDKWLEKLLQGIQYLCKSAEDISKDDDGDTINHKDNKGDVTNHKDDKDVINHKDDKGDNDEKGDVINHKDEGKKPTFVKFFLWPDAAVPAVTALEKVAHEALSFDFQKYNQKMRQLMFNLRKNAVLARRLLNGELDPAKIFNMSPTELKEGLTAEETASKEPLESARMQMTDARCSRCTEKKVGLTDVIQAGHGDRYQLECIACGYSWYASRDEASTLTIDAPSSTRSIGTAPWATAKFEDVEKKLVSPRESERQSNYVYKKTTEPYVPVLESRKSVNKPKTEGAKS